MHCCFFVCFTSIFIFFFVFVGTFFLFISVSSVAFPDPHPHPHPHAPTDALHTQLANELPIFNARVTDVIHTLTRAWLHGMARFFAKATAATAGLPAEFQKAAFVKPSFEGALSRPRPLFLSVLFLLFFFFFFSYVFSSHYFCFFASFGIYLLSMADMISCFS